MDPVEVLHKNIGMLENVINDWMGNTVHNNTTPDEHEVSLLQTVDKLVLLQQHVLSLRKKTQNEQELLREVSNLIFYLTDGSQKLAKTYFGLYRKRQTPI